MTTLSTMPSSHTDESALIPIGQVSKILSVSISTLRRWDKQGYLTAVRPSGHQRMYRRADVEALIESAS
jgi:excisionase family DNA binding protein